MKRYRFSVTGRVQGVGFRMFTRRTASSFGLTGWVRNCGDGSVELEAQGDPQQLEAFEEALRQGPPLGHVRDLSREGRSPRQDEQDFRIRH